MVVYGLIDPRSGELRYVGQTTRDVGVRLSQHLATARTGSIRHVNGWLRQLLAARLKPDVEVLETHGTAEALVEAEKHFIAYFRSIGCRLTNHTDGGEGSEGYKHATASIEKMRLAHLRRSCPSLDVRHRMSVAHLGKRHKSPRSEQFRLANSRRNGGRPFCDQHGVIYMTQGEAATRLKLDRACISRVLRGQRSHAGGYTFKYTEESWPSPV